MLHGFDQETTSCHKVLLFYSTFRVETSYKAQNKPRLVSPTQKLIWEHAKYLRWSLMVKTVNG